MVDTFICLFQIDEALFCYWNLNAHGHKLWHLKYSPALKGVQKDEDPFGNFTYVIAET